MPPLLTPDAISRIMRGAQPDELRPLVQVFDLRPFKQKEEEVGQSPRFRMLASDGAHAVQGLFAGDLNAKCERDEIKRYSILRLENYQITPVGDRGDKKCVSRGDRIESLDHDARFRARERGECRARRRTMGERRARETGERLTKICAPSRLGS